MKNSLLKLDEHTLEVLKKSSASLIVKILGMAISLVVSVYLGNKIGAEGLGILSLSVQIVSVLLVIALCGLPQVIIKEIAIAFEKNNFKHVGDVTYTSFVLVGVSTLFISCFGIIISPWLANYVFGETSLTYPLIISIIVCTPQAISRILSSALIGYRKIWQSNLVDNTLSAAVVGILIVGANLFNFDIDINVVSVLYAISRVVVSLSMFIYWKSLYSNTSKRSFIYKPLLKTSLPLFFVSAALLFSSSLDSLMLGWLSNTEEVGLYTVALKIALLTSFMQQITMSTVAPKIASLYYEHRLPELERMIRRITKGLTIFGLFVFLTISLCGDVILSFWGETFKKGYVVLMILAFGQLINIASGPVGSLLMLCGYEDLIKNITLTTVFLNVVLNFAFISKYGASGAAIATSATYTLNMLICLFYVETKMNISPIRKIQS